MVFFRGQGDWLFVIILFRFRIIPGYALTAPYYSYALPYPPKFFFSSTYVRCSAYVLRFIALLHCICIFFLLQYYFCFPALRARVIKNEKKNWKSNVYFVCVSSCFLHSHTYTHNRCLCLCVRACVTKFTTTSYLCVFVCCSSSSVQRREVQLQLVFAERVWYRSAFPFPIHSVHYGVHSMVSKPVQMVVNRSLHRSNSILNEFVDRK